MRILLDTNFIITCAKEGIDFERLANEIIDEKIEWIVPQEVLNELGNLKDRRGVKVKDRLASKIGFEILSRIKPKVVELGCRSNVDIGIINYILGTDIVLATLDREMKKKTGNRILTIRARKKLELQTR
ncbi:hypothetical protein D6829_00665 [Candidatus Pacearchaeota archaeon]|nr:MAG: hypothetical protein D6829_00665 [Candidatus Pacearchaeota archaeon]